MMTFFLSCVSSYFLDDEVNNCCHKEKLCYCSVVRKTWEHQIHWSWMNLVLYFVPGLLYLNYITKCLNQTAKVVYYEESMDKKTDMMKLRLKKEEDLQES